MSTHDQRMMRLVAAMDQPLAIWPEALTDWSIAATINQVDQSEPTKVDGYMRIGDVAVIDVLGPLVHRDSWLSRLLGLQSTVELRNRLVKAANNYEVRRIVLNIDSPGGSAIGNQEAFDTISQVKASKPVIASINGLAASAAYWIATAATKVNASPSSMVGGVGAVFVHRERSRADNHAGVNYTIIRSGQFKADGNDREPLSDQARQNLQERVDDFRLLFVSAVAFGRNTSESRVYRDFGDGKVFIAKEAQRRGMIDEIATLESVVKRTRVPDAVQSA